MKITFHGLSKKVSTENGEGGWGGGMDRMEGWQEEG